MKSASTTSTRVPVLEIYSTAQGEGPTVGIRQIFVRLAGCDLRCAFCDTPESFPTPRQAKIDGHVRSSDPKSATLVDNPMSTDDVVSAVRALQHDLPIHRSVSITGGEPLLRPEVVRSIARGVRAIGLEVHLETGGHRPRELAQVLPYIDAVSPDLKLESACRTPTPWDLHAACYELLASAPQKVTAVKAIASLETTVHEIAEAAAFVASFLPQTPLVLQPVTPLTPDSPQAPTGAHMLELQAAAALHHADVRVIPQLHRVLGLR